MNRASRQLAPTLSTMARDDARDPDFIRTVDSGFDDAEQAEVLAPSLTPEAARELRETLDGIAAARVRAQQKLRSAYIH